MPYKPFHGGFGLLNLHGIPKATYRVYELLHKLGDEMYETRRDSASNIDVYSIKKNDSIMFLLSNHNSLLQPIYEEKLQLRVENLSEIVSCTIERVDENNANALKRWQDIGEPGYPTEAQLADIYSHSFIQKENYEAKVVAGSVELEVTMPPMAVALITLYY
jgi:xylan 1,4-beta-xylosidase